MLSPISAIRDHSTFLSELLRLPERVVPVAGMCVGWPSERGYITPRLGLDATVHTDRYSERDLTTDDLAEWNYGDYEGRATKDIRAEVPGWTIFRDGAPGGETADEVAARADRVLARAVEAAGVVALFSHGHFLRVLGARWIGQPAAAGAWLGLDTATLSCLGHEREQRVLRVWNS